MTGANLRWSKGYAIHSVSPRSLPAAREYVRRQNERHPNETIQHWEGDTPEYEPAGGDEWRGPERSEMGVQTKIARLKPRLGGCR